MAGGGLEIIVQLACALCPAVSPSESIRVNGPNQASVAAETLVSVALTAIGDWCFDGRDSYCPSCSTPEQRMRVAWKRFCSEFVGFDEFGDPTFEPVLMRQLRSGAGLHIDDNITAKLRPDDSVTARLSLPDGTWAALHNLSIDAYVHPMAEFDMDDGDEDFEPITSSELWGVLDGEAELLGYESAATLITHINETGEVTPEILDFIEMLPSWVLLPGR